MVFSDPKTWVTGETVTAAELNQDIRDNTNALFPDGATAEETDSGVGQEWIPVVTAGSGSQGVTTTMAVAYRVGALAFAWYRGIFSGALVGGGGDLSVNLPYTGANPPGNNNQGAVIGSYRLTDSSVIANSISGACFFGDAAEQTVRFGRPEGNQVQTNTPFTIAVDDVLTFFVCYPIASADS